MADKTTCELECGAYGTYCKCNDMAHTKIQTKDWQDYPIGTKVFSINGGHWEKTQRGYQWHSGRTFPTPSGDWSHIVEPIREEQQEVR